MRSLPGVVYDVFPIQAAEARRTGAAEWAASCPWCGGEDRFRIFAASGTSGDRYWCRQCGRKGFMDGNNRKPTAAELAERERKRKEQAEAERAARQARIDAMNASAYWRGYHDGMRDAGRKLWRQRGLPDAVQDLLELGVTELAGVPALSIPYHDRHWVVETVQYRLLKADTGSKYRFEKGHPPGGYWTSPGTDGWPVIICEGAIKAAVLFWRLVVELNRPYNVVALSGKTPGRGELDKLAEDIGGADTFLLLDPDARPVEREKIGACFANTRHVTLPGKVDDLLNAGIISAQAFENLYLRQATLGVI